MRLLAPILILCACLTAHGQSIPDAVLHKLLMATRYPVASVLAQPCDEYTKLMLHFEGENGTSNIVDSSASPMSCTVSGKTVAISTATFTNGTSSLYVHDGAVMLADSDLYAFTNDFTIEFWFNLHYASNGWVWVFGQNDAGEYHPVTFATENGNPYPVRWYATASGGSWSILNGVTKTGFSKDTWYHHEIDRSGSNIYLFADGICYSTSYYSGAFWNSEKPFQIGSYPGYNEQAYYDEFRISVGIARHTANFTPSNKPACNP